MFLFLLSRTHTWLHTPFLSDPETPPPVFRSLPHQIPPLVSVEHCLSFELSFVISSLNFFFFVSIFGFVSRSTPTFSSIFFFIFSSFRFLSICSTRTVPPPGPPSNSVETYQFLLQLGRQCSVPIMTRKVTNTRSNSFLPGSSYMCVSVFKRGGTAAAERSRFFKYDIKKSRRGRKTLIY